jgi:MEMO1 family protein
MKVRARFLPQGWYPDSPDAVIEEIKGFDSYFKAFDRDWGVIRGGVAPHAGWYFSGRLAALVFHLAAKQGRPDVVALLGGHLGGGSGIVYADDAWSTPLGSIPVDLELIEALTGRVRLKAEGPATNDNTVEIHTPLTKYFFPESRLVALRAPHTAEASIIGQALAESAVEQEKSMLVIASTDLTHYGPNYGFTPVGQGEKAVRWVKEENDRGFIDQVLAMNESGVLEHAAKHHSACSAGGVAAGLASCKVLGSVKGRLLDYYTSHDVMPGSSFVGYAGIIF